MKKFNENDHVITIENGSIKNGIVSKCFYEMNPPVLLVEFDDGNVEKVLPEKLALAPKTEDPKEESREPIIKSEITITPDEFRDIEFNVITETAIKTKDFMLGMKLSAFLALLHKALFVDER